MVSTESILQAGDVEERGDLDLWLHDAHRTWLAQREWAEYSRVTSHGGDHMVALSMKVRFAGDFAAYLSCLR